MNGHTNSSCISLKSRQIIHLFLMISYILQVFVKADTTTTLYVNSDSATNGDGSQAKPYNDLFYAMNTISKVVTQFPLNEEVINNMNAQQQFADNAVTSVLINLNADAQKAYNMFNPANSPKTYLISQTQNVNIQTYSPSGNADNKPVIQFQDFLTVQNSSFSMQGCKVIFYITDENKSMQQTTNQHCQMDLIGSLPHFYQITFQILDNTSGGFIPTQDSILQKEWQDQQIRDQYYTELQIQQDEGIFSSNKQKQVKTNPLKDNSPKEVYLSRSFLCTHQQQILNSQRVLSSVKGDQSQSYQNRHPSESQDKENQENNTFIKKDWERKVQSSSGNSYQERKEIIRSPNQASKIHMKKQQNRNLFGKNQLKMDANVCAFSEIEIVDSFIKVDSENFYKIWVGSIIELNFANSSESSVDACELSNIEVRNVALCSDVDGTIFQLNYNGSQDADFEQNVVSNIFIDQSALFMVNIFQLSLLQSEMKECQFKNFTISNSLMQSVVGLDQSGYIRISISNTKSVIKRELQLIDHKLINNKFINARYFAVEPQLQTEEVKTIIQNVLIDGNIVINSNSKEIQMFSNATQISIYNSTIQNNIFEQIVVFDSKFNQVVDTIEFNGNYIFNNTLTNAIFFSAELMDQSSIRILENQFLHNFQVYNSSMSLIEQTLIQSTMFNLVGKASELDFLKNTIYVGKPVTPDSNDCSCYNEQFSYFLIVEAIGLVNIQEVVFEDICKEKTYFLRELVPKYGQNLQYENKFNLKVQDSINSERRGGFLQLKGFAKVIFMNSIFKNILTSSPLMTLNDENYVSSFPKNTYFKNITLHNNTLLLINEASLLNFDYQDQHIVNFIDNNFKKNILIIAMDRVIGYTAPCISFKGYSSVFTMHNNTFKDTSIRFEVYSLSIGGNVLIAAVNITVSESVFKQSCQNMIDSSIAFSPSARQCLKNETDVDESFLKFSDGGALNLFGTSTITLKNNSFHDNEAKRGGAVFLSGQVENIHVLYNNFTNNSAIEGGAIYSEQLKVMKKVTFSNINFLENSALKYGIVIDSFLFFKHFEMDHCIFANNYIRSQGSDSTYMVKLEKLGNCTVKFSNVFMFGNNTRKFSGDFLQIYHSNQKDSRSNKDVYLNTDDLQHITFQYCYFYIAGKQTVTNSKYFPQAISVMSRVNGYNPVKTPVYLNNVVFSGENHRLSFLQYFPQQLTNKFLLSFLDERIEDLRVIKYSSQAFYANNVDAIMNTTNVLNIVHTSGCVTIRNSYLQVTDSSFQMNYKATQYYNASQLMITSEQPEKHRSLIKNVVFKGYVPKVGDLQYDSQMISLNNIQNVEITNCTFIDASADYGSAIQIQEKAQNISVVQCDFQNNWSRAGGGSIYIEKDCSILNIHKSNFTNSRSYYGIGGALLIEKMNNNFTITHNRFYNNLAVFGNSISIMAFEHDSLKSVLAFNSYEQDLLKYMDTIDEFAKKVEQNQKMLVQNDNILYSDWQQIIPSSEICLNFTMNYRSFSYEWDFQQQTVSNTSSTSTLLQSESYSSTIKNTPTALTDLSVNEFLNYNFQRKAKNKNQLTNKVSADLFETLDEQLSYQTTVQYTLDSVGQDAIFTPIKPYVQASFSSSYDTDSDTLQIVNNQFVISDNRGYLQTVAFGINNTITYYSYQKLLNQLSNYNLVDSNKNATYNLLFSDTYSLSSVVPNYPYFNKTTYQPYALGLGLSECNSGFSFDSTNRICSYCQQGVYTLDPKGYSPCQACEQNALCLGGYKMEVNEGYWRNDLYSSNVMYCNKNPYNCLVPDSSNYAYTCNEGYTGPLCQACDTSNKYFTNGDGRCYICNNNWMTILLFVGKKLIFLLYEMFYIYTTAFANTLFATRGHECHALNVRRLNKVYVRIIQTYFQIMSLIISQYSVVGEQFFQLFNQFFQLIGFPVDSVNYNYECWFYNLLGPNSQLYPYFASLISLCEPLFKILVVFVLWIIKRIFKIESMKNRYFIISITSIILIEQLGVIKILLGSFKCISISGVGSFMERNPNVSCQTDTYDIFTGFIYIPMMILWAGGFTLLLFFYICRNKRNLEQKQMKLFFGFYYMCFRQKYFYWDIIIYLMKLLLLMLNYFVLDSDKLRFSCTTLILLGYCLAIKIYKPYTLDRQNKCDQILFYNLIFTMFLCYNIDNDNTTSLNVLFIILLSVSNLSFIGYISWRMFYIVRYFFKKIKNGNQANANAKNSVKQSIQDKEDEESEDEEQKNYLMQAELEYNHLEIAIKDNNEEIIIKEDDEDLQQINMKQGVGMVPVRKQETEQIRQRYEFHQMLKSMVEHNHNQAVQIEHNESNSDNDQNEDSLMHDPTPSSSGAQKASFAFQKHRHNNGGSIIGQGSRPNNFKSFNQPIGKHDFGGVKKRSILQSHIYDRAKTGSTNNMQSLLINPSSNNNLLKDSHHKESVGGQSNHSNNVQNVNVRDNYYNQHRNMDFQNSMVSHSSQHNAAALKKSFLCQIERDLKKKRAKASTLQNHYNYANPYDYDEIEDEENYHDHDDSQLHENHYDQQHRHRRFNKLSALYAEDEVRQRNECVMKKSDLFQDNLLVDPHDNNLTDNVNDLVDNEFVNQNDNNNNHDTSGSYVNNNETNILGSNIKVNMLNQHLFSDRRATGSKFNPQTTRAPSTYITNQANQLFSTQNEIDAQLGEAVKDVNSINQFANQNNNKYDSDSFCLKDQSRHFGKEGEEYDEKEDEEDEEEDDDQHYRKDKSHSRNNSQNKDKNN